MSSLIEELHRREAAAGEEATGLRREIELLSERLAVAEERLSRLEIARDTVAEILGVRVGISLWTGRSRSLG